MSDVADLEAAVSRMRALGVTKWNGIELGPPAPAPPQEPTPKEILEKAAREEERRRDVMFAASGTRPLLRRVKP